MRKSDLFRACCGKGATTITAFGRDSDAGRVVGNQYREQKGKPLGVSWVEAVGLGKPEMG